MARVKICGINAPDALAAAIEAGADWVGYVFYPSSPRAVTPAEAAAIDATRPGGAARVGLFVAPSDAEIEAAVVAVTLDVLQVYVSPDRAAELRQRFRIPVWRAVGVATPGDLPRSPEPADALLLDAKPPAGASRPGGNAHSFDWRMLKTWQAPLPWLLAGGLTPATVANAIALSGAEAVDVSSGVERARGVKDPALIRAFVDAARQASPRADQRDG